MLTKKPPKWKSLSPPYAVGVDGFTYLNVIYDEDRWVEAQFCRPLPFDLCDLKTEESVYKGWWDTLDWEGLRLHKKEKVLYWKKCRENAIC